LEKWQATILFRLESVSGDNVAVGLFRKWMRRDSRVEGTMAKINTLFWDNGGVILTNGWDRNSRRAAVEKFKLDWADFEDRHELMLNAFETGRATIDEYLRRTVFYKERAFTPDDFKKFMFEQSQPFSESLEFLGKLAQTRAYLMASLNNESREINEYRIHRFHLRDYFQAFFSSCYLGVRKPEEQIYRLALEIAQREPEECILIDDRGLNLECAREIGMHTIQFKNVDQLRQDLAQQGIVVPGK
jgi:putative hydrolase of the HAD superfamily